MEGIKMKDCKFYVNEEKHTVICVIPNTHDLLHKFIFEHFKFPYVSIKWGLTLKGYDVCELPSSFMGKAVCSADDEWDEELGRRIAFSRAKDKCYKSFFRRANWLIQTVDGCLNQMLDQFNSFGEKCQENKDRLDASIEHYLDKKEKGEA